MSAWLHTTIKMQVKRYTYHVGCEILGSHLETAGLLTVEGLVVVLIGLIRRLLMERGIVLLTCVCVVRSNGTKVCPINKAYFKVIQLSLLC